MIIPIDHELEVSEIIEVPQIIQVMDDHDLVLNSMFVGIPHCQKYQIYTEDIQKRQSLSD